MSIGKMNSCDPSQKFGTKLHVRRVRNQYRFSGGFLAPISNKCVIDPSFLHYVVKKFVFFGIYFIAHVQINGRELTFR